MASTIKLRKGTKTEISGITLALSELGYCTDTKELFVGDGVGNTLIGTVLLDEDDFASDSDAHAPTQQSVKQFVANNYVDVTGGAFSGDVSLDFEGADFRVGDATDSVVLSQTNVVTEVNFGGHTSGSRAKLKYDRATGDFTCSTGAVGSEITYFELDGATHDFTHTNNVNIGDATTSTESRVIEIGKGRTGSGYAFIDLIGDTTYTDYGLRLIRRDGGENTNSELAHRGTGTLEIKTEDAGDIDFYTTNILRGAFSSAGLFSLTSGTGINEFSTDDTLAGDSDDAVPTEAAVKGYVDGLNFFENDITLTADYTITTNKNAMSAGPITIDSGVTITVPAGSTWTVV